MRKFFTRFLCAHAWLRPAIYKGRLCVQCSKCFTYSPGVVLD